MSDSQFWGLASPISSPSLRVLICRMGTPSLSCRPAEASPAMTSVQKTSRVLITHTRTRLLTSCRRAARVLERCFQGHLQEQDSRGVPTAKHPQRGERTDLEHRWRGETGGEGSPRPRSPFRKRTQLVRASKTPENCPESEPGLGRGREANRDPGTQQSSPRVPKTGGCPLTGVLSEPICDRRFV